MPSFVSKPRRPSPLSAMTPHHVQALACKLVLVLLSASPAYAETKHGPLATEWAYGSHFSAIFAVQGNHFLASQGRSLVQVSLGDGSITQVFGGMAGKVQAAAISPDGKRVAAADELGTLIIWDVASKKILGTYHESYGSFTSLRWAEDGHSLAASDGEDILLRWQPGQPAESLMIRERQKISDYWPVSNDQTYVLLDSDDYDAPDQVLLWKKGSDPIMVKALAPELDDRIRFLDGELLVQTKGELQRMRLPSLSVSRTPMPYELIGINASPLRANVWNAQQALVNLDQNKQALFDLQQQRLLGTWASNQGSASLPGDAMLVEMDGGFRLWRPGPAGMQPVSPDFGPIRENILQSRYSSLAFSPDGRWLSAGTDQPVRLAAIDLASGKLFQAPLNPEMPDQPYTPGEARACFLPDGSLLVYTSHGQEIYVQYSPDHSMPEMEFYPELRRWQPESGKIEPFLFGEGTNASKGSPNADCSLFLVEKEADTGEIWDQSVRQKLLDVPHGSFNATANASQILVEVTDYSNYHSELYDRSSGKLVHSFDAPDYLLGDPDSRNPWLLNRLAQTNAEGEAGDIGLYDPQGIPMKLLPGSAESSIQMITPDHRSLLLAETLKRPPEYPPTNRNGNSYDQALILLDLGTGQQVKLPGLIHEVYGKPPLAFWLHNGEQSLFALHDYSLLQWRLRDQKLQQRFDADTAFPLVALAVSPRQDRIALMDQAGLVQIYRLPDFERLLRLQLPWGFGE